MELRDKNGLTYTEFMAQYKEKNYKKPSVTADIVVLIKGDPLKVLLIKRRGHPYIGCYALPGGFSMENETIEQTAARELEEETSIKDLPLEMVKVFSTPGRDPRTWVMDVAFVSLLDNMPKAKAGDDASRATYFDLYVEKEGGHVKLWFEDPDEGTSFGATLLETTRSGINGPVYDYKQLESRLAFDHAEEIAYSLKKANLI